MATVIDTRPGYRVFCEVVAQRGPRSSALAEICGLAPSETRKILKELVASGHICEFEKRYYVDNHGAATVARHNRNHFQTVKSRITNAPTPGDANGPMQEKRDQAVNEVYRKLRRQEQMVWNGRRKGIGGMGNTEPWYPDLWTVNPEGPSPDMLVAVLVEPSAVAESAIKSILHDYRSAVGRNPDAEDLKVFAKDETAAERFRAIGDDLRIKVKVLSDFLREPESTEGIPRRWSDEG